MKPMKKDQERKRDCHVSFFDGSIRVWKLGVYCSIQLGKEQVEAQNKASQEIAKSNIDGAQIIASEIAYQTQALGVAIFEVGDKISGNILRAADQICDAVDVLGDRLCVELSEIKWQLAQQNETLEKILEVLYESRNNEARQLVQQGVRHYVNNEYVEAEERFKLALGSDTTDYQVLMNLAYIEIHKDNSSQAFTFFNKALSLPQHLDSASTARTLWAIARLYYAETDYQKAFSYAEQALKHEKHDDPKGIYSLGVYGALAEKVPFSLAILERAIAIEPAYFSRAAVDPDLDKVREEVLKMLSRLSLEAHSKANRVTDELANALFEAEKLKESITDDEFALTVQKHVHKGGQRLQDPSYSSCLSCLENMRILQKTVPHVKNLYDLYSKNRAIKEEFKNRERKHKDLSKHGTLKVPDSVSFTALFLPIAYLSAGVFCAVFAIIVGKIEALGAGIAIGAVWPVFALVGIAKGAGTQDYELTKNAYFGIVIGLILSGLLWTLLNGRREHKKAISSKISYAENQLHAVKKTLSDIQHNIDKTKSTINELMTQVKW